MLHHTIDNIHIYGFWGMQFLSLLADGFLLSILWELLLRSKYLQWWSWWSNILELCKIHWPNTRMATFENCISPSILTFVRVNRHNDQMEKFHCSQLWIEKGLKKILRIFLFGIPLTAAWVEHPESKSGKLDLW